MKPNKPFAYSVYFSINLGENVQEELFSNWHDAEAFASLHNYATVIDNFTGGIVSVWQSGRKTAKSITEWEFKR